MSVSHKFTQKHRNCPSELYVVTEQMFDECFFTEWVRPAAILSCKPLQSSWIHLSIRAKDLRVSVCMWSLWSAVQHWNSLNITDIPTFGPEHSTRHQLDQTHIRWLRPRLKWSWEMLDLTPLAPADRDPNGTDFKVVCQNKMPSYPNAAFSLVLAAAWVWWCAA